MHKIEELTGNTVDDLNMVSENPQEWDNNIVSLIIDRAKDGFDSESGKARINLYKLGLETIKDTNQTYLKDLIMNVNKLDFESIKNVRTIDEPCYELLDRALNKNYIYLEEPFYLYYAGYGQYLSLLGSNEQAQIYFDKAYALNPYAPESVMGLTTYYLEKGEIDAILPLNRKAIQYAHDNEFVSLCFQNIGYYGVLSFNDELANAAFTMFITLSKESDMAQLMIKDILPHFQAIESDSKLRKILDKYQIPFSYDPNFQNLLKETGMSLYKKGDKESAIYFLSIYSMITDDEVVLGILDGLEKECDEDGSIIGDESIN